MSCKRPAASLLILIFLFLKISISCAQAPTIKYTSPHDYKENAAIVPLVPNNTRANSIPLPAPPNISYQTPQTYTTGIIISPLAPKNTGGPVPATIYGQVTAFAGSGFGGLANGTGTAAGFYLPMGITTDAAGNMYVGDSANALIREVTPGAVVTTFAGAGRGFSDGTRITALFGNVFGLTFDAAGNLYVCDEFAAVRKITPAGAVTTLAGNGTMGFANGTGRNAIFNVIINIVVDASGNIFVTDQFNNMIRKVTQAGVVTTFAGNLNPGFVNGNGTGASFNYPFGLTIDPSGNLYVGDRYNYVIRKITPAGDVSTFAGNGLGGFADGTVSTASFSEVEGMAFDAIGNLYIADELNERIREITPAGIVSTVAGNGNPRSVNGVGQTASFSDPVGITLDGKGNAYITEFSGNIVSKLVLTGYTIDKPVPPGLTFDPTTGIISGTPTAASPATDYTVTAYNIGGSSTTIVNIKVVLDARTVMFGPLPPKTACDADFDPGATSLDPPITYTSDNPAVATIVNGKIHITGVGTAVITATNSISSVSQTLTVSAALTTTVTISPDAIGGCQGAEITFTATPANGGATPSYQWQVNGQDAGTNSPTFVSSTLNTNDKITCVITSNAVCTTSATATSNVATVELDPPVTTSVSITSPVTGPVCKGTPITFTAVPNTPDSNPVFQWRVNGNIQGSNSPTFTSSNLADGDQVACYLQSSGKCLVNPVVLSNSITISLSPVDACMIVIPNTFTPNGDGINDLWNIKSLLYYPDCIVRIFSRQGQQVFLSRGYSKPWDGTINNSPVPVGSYYYIISLNNGTPPLAGSITILR